jgi:hypothetical protein
MQFLTDACGKKTAVNNRPHVTIEGVARTMLSRIGNGTMASIKNPEEKIFHPKDPAVVAHYREWKEFVKGIIKDAANPYPNPD